LSKAKEKLRPKFLILTSSCFIIVDFILQLKNRLKYISISRLNEQKAIYSNLSFKTGRVDSQQS
jgi:hypothetical protein